VLPDVFEGGVALDFFEQPENEKKIAMGKFFGPGGAAFAPKVTGQINSAAQTLVTEYPSITKIGAVGFCYGGKVCRSIHSCSLRNDYPRITLKISLLVPTGGHPSSQCC